MNYLKTLSGAAALSLAAMATPASAVTLILDGPEEDFSFDGVGSPWSEEFTFTITDIATFEVTDLFLAGDQFEVFINGISAGLTSLPTGDGGDFTGDFDTAFGSPLWSSAGFVLAPGSYTITGTTTLSPFGSGGAAARLVSGGVLSGAVPEPATWLMLILGFAAVGYSLRSKKSNQPKVRVRFT